MIDLFSKLSATQLLIIIIMIMLAAKELIVLTEFFGKKIRSIFDKEYAEKDEKEEILEKLELISNHVNKCEEECKQLSEKIQTIQKEYRSMFDKQQKTLNTLIASDIADIKSDIVKQYHRFMEKQWIDDFSMDTIEKRFARYEEEGGNSYVHTLIEKLRQLPNQPPE